MADFLAKAQAAIGKVCTHPMVVAGFMGYIVLHVLHVLP